VCLLLFECTSLRHLSRPASGQQPQPDKPGLESLDDEWLNLALHKPLTHIPTGVPIHVLGVPPISFSAIRHVRAVLTNIKPVSIGLQLNQDSYKELMEERVPLLKTVMDSPAQVKNRLASITVKRKLKIRAMHAVAMQILGTPVGMEYYEAIRWFEETVTLRSKHLGDLDQVRKSRATIPLSFEPAATETPVISGSPSHGGVETMKLRLSASGRMSFLDMDNKEYLSTCQLSKSAEILDAVISVVRGRLESSSLALAQNERSIAYRMLHKSPSHTIQSILKSPAGEALIGVTAVLSPAEARASAALLSKCRPLAYRYGTKQRIEFMRRQLDSVCIELAGSNRELSPKDLPVVAIVDRQFVSALEQTWTTQ
jgi:hypothetical protein